MLCLAVTTGVGTAAIAQHAIPRPGARGTVMLTASSTVKFQASPDHTRTSGSPPVALLTGYRGELFLASNVTNGFPVGLPALTLAFGKPAPDAGGTITIPNIRNMIYSNVQYVLFVSAIGPGGTSGRAGPSAPFMTQTGGLPPPAQVPPTPPPAQSPPPPPPERRSGMNGGAASKPMAVMSAEYSTYFGGSGDDLAVGVAADDSGNVYIAGGTDSGDFPTTAGAFQRAIRLQGQADGNITRSDAFVAKRDRDGRIVWSTLLGGSGYDRANAIAVDNRGFVYVAGAAGKGFPVTPGAFQSSFQGSADLPPYGSQDGFVCKLAAADGRPVFCSYFGTSDRSSVRSLAVDGSGNVFIAAGYLSGTYPSAVRERFNNVPHPGAGDAVLAKISGDGTRVLWATFLGGSGAEGGEVTVCVDASDSPYVLTTTTSSDALTTAGTLGRSYRGNGDLYLVSLTPATGQVIWATYLGGSGHESASGHNLAIDRGGSLYVAATTQSSDLPTTAGAFQRTNSGGTGDMFVARVSSDGAHLLGGTYVGTRADDRPSGLAIDSAGNIYLVGATESRDFPMAADAWRSGPAGKRNGVALKLSPDFSQLLYATYMGSSDLNEDGPAIAADSQGNVYLAGETRDLNWPVVNATQERNSGRFDAFLVKLASRPRR